MKFLPPPAVSVAAEDGLRLVSEGYGGKGLTKEAIARARRLAAGVLVELEGDYSIRRMRNWFRRHAVDKRPRWRERRTPGWVAWQIWGGDAARAWVEAVSRRYLR